MLHVILKPNPSADPDDPQCAHISICETTIASAIAQQHERIDYVIADGPELEFIFREFNLGLPMRLNTPSVHWFGDDAKFIVANWT